MINWKDYTFTSLNDLSNYESEINKLTSYKYKYTYYKGLFLKFDLDKFPAIQSGRYYMMFYFTDGIAEKIGIRDDGTLENSIDEGRNVYRLEFYTDADELVAVYTCNEQLDASELLDDLGFYNVQAIDVNRQLTRLESSWQPMIDRAKQELIYQLERLCTANNDILTNVLDKISNKDYLQATSAYLTLHYIFDDLSVSTTQEELYSKKSYTYYGKYQKQLKMVIDLLKIDTNGDGVPDTTLGVSFTRIRM